MYYSYAKRLFDLFFSVIALILLLPLLVFVGLLIKLGSKGPAIFKQERLGKDMKPFILYKFRTMIAGAQDQGTITLNKDPRITGIGKYLRKTKIDELPQLFNVLKGDMSFVGPRPMPKEDMALYKKEEKALLLFKPGITSPASIKYSREEELMTDEISAARSQYCSLLPKKLAYDLEYFDHPSLSGDMMIILRTIGLVFSTIIPGIFPKLRQK